MEFLLAPEKEVLYGGAAGGGKSYAILMAALQYVQYPGYSALVLRRTLKELESPPNGLLVVAKDWLSGTTAKPTDGGRIWTFPSGATLTFGYLETEDDKYRYQGSEYQFIGFDELTQFTQTQYEYLFSRLRKTTDNLCPSRMRSTSNPGGKGHLWVKEMFIAGKGPDRQFIPALLTENPYLDQADYINSLMHLDPVTRAQLLKGDWDIQVAGNFFKRQWFELVDSYPRHARSLRFWDMAATKEGDYTVGARVALADGVYYVLDLKRARETPGEVAQLVRQTAELDGKDVAVRMEEEPGSAGVSMIHHYATQVLVGFDFKGIRTTGDKVNRAGPVSSASEHGNVKLVRGPWNGAFLDECVLFPQGEHDDQVDAVSGAVHALTSSDPSRFAYVRVGKVRG